MNYDEFWDLVISIEIATWSYIDVQSRENWVFYPPNVGSIRSALEELTSSQIYYLRTPQYPCIEWHFFPPSFTYRQAAIEMVDIIEQGA